MATIFNAHTTQGLVITPDTSGEIEFQSNGTQVLKVTGATGSFDLPVGTTAERPTSPTTGTLRYNTTESEIETYDGSSWTSVGASTWTTTGSNIYYTTGKVSIGTTVSYSTVSLFEGSVNQDYAGSQTLPNSTVTILNGNSRADLSFVSKREDAAQTQNVARIEAEGSGGWNSKLHFYTANNWGDSSNHAMSIYGTNLQFNSGYGSVATAYGCRAWVNFQGTGTVAIRASGNVSSITDGGAGKYRVNFATAMPDINYSIGGGDAREAPGAAPAAAEATSFGVINSSSCYVYTQAVSGAETDAAQVFVQIFR